MRRYLFNLALLVPLLITSSIATAVISDGGFSTTAPFDKNDVDKTIKKDLDKSDLKKNVDTLIKAGNAGNAEAQYILFACYRFGKCGVSQDGTKSFYWLKKAASNNVPQAQYILGYNELLGVEGKPNQAEAFKLFNASYKAGFIFAGLPLAYMYDKGVSTEIDYKKAFALFKQLASIQHPLATYNLGVMYAKGEGIEQDFKKALVLFKVAYKLGYQPALEGIDKIEKDKCQAYSTTVFGLSLHCNSRAAYRTKLLANGFKPIRTDDTHLYDLYSGAYFGMNFKFIALGYSPDGRLAEIMFKTSDTEYNNLAKRFEKQYGKPEDSNYKSGPYWIKDGWKIENDVYLFVKKTDTEHYVQFVITGPYEVLQKYESKH